MNLVLRQEPVGWVCLLPSEMLPLATLSSSPHCQVEAFWGLSVTRTEQGVSVHPPGQAEKGPLDRHWPVARLASSATVSRDGFDSRVCFFPTIN